MSFRALQWLRPAAYVAFAVAAAGFWFRPPYWVYAVMPFVALGVFGAGLGLVFLFTGLRLRCPFCRVVGPAAVDEKGYPRMDCATCGTVRSRGLRVTREP